MTSSPQKTKRPAAKPKEGARASRDIRSEKPSDDDASVGARRRQIMQEAARLFGTRGFEATTIRDIASATGILGGSIYYHFASKEDIFVAVHGAGMEKITEAVLRAIEGVEDPWDRLEAAAVAHCSDLLGSSEVPVIVSPYYSESLDALRETLVAQRDRYETVIAGLVDALDLPPSLDRSLFRLNFLGALNWMPTWYRTSSRLTPAEIGRQLVLALRPR
ncbi:TetR/AcrR family transcriptional regulator [Tianweitania sp. BSSL-BM11]|uniref:TetR/AcrR family transcriptional regulator n=1 Tax=Tianweitania aestuarii TaxID=2814886 RepID=A0ABS5S034_9HYPH|nr:TetR/AcrR family transcriptional regulator [Tianweitania aestuarii]MBS9721891.1 TetR/AcrR family transcriptional regulator [Tianweitania aestuarii]